MISKNKFKINLKLKSFLIIYLWIQDITKNI